MAIKNLVTGGLGPDGEPASWLVTDGLGDHEAVEAAETTGGSHTEALTSRPGRRIGRMALRPPFRRMD